MHIQILELALLPHKPAEEVLAVIKDEDLVYLHPKQIITRTAMKSAIANDPELIEIFSHPDQKRARDVSLPRAPSPSVRSRGSGHSTGPGPRPGERSLSRGAAACARTSKICLRDLHTMCLLVVFRGFTVKHQSPGVGSLAQPF